MNEADKIKKLREGIMCAVVHLFATNPQEVIDLFSLEDLEDIADATLHLRESKLEGVYKDLLDMTEPKDEDSV